MTWNKAYSLGIAIAVLFHVLVFVFHCSSLFIFPGTIAYFLIGGLHGRGDPYDTISSIVEVLINASMYAALIYAVSRLLRGGKHANQNR
jgi:hypothetical protein